MVVLPNVRECILDSWILIPARGGSVGIPRKNVRVLAGKPLIGHAISAALEVLPRQRVLVITDDDEIGEVAAQAGASVVLETQATPPGETLDTKILRNLGYLRSLGAGDGDLVVTVQPTSPLLRSETIREAILRFGDENVNSVLSVSDDRHLSWGIGPDDEAVPKFSARVNRQQLPPEYRETGGIIAAKLSTIEKHRTRVVEPVSLLVLSDDEALDIDTYSDLYAAAHLMSRKRIAIRVDASRSVGMGHVYRMLSFAAELARHELLIYLHKDSELGQRFFAQYPYPTKVVDSEAEFYADLRRFNPDLVVLDILDTTSAQIDAIRLDAPSVKIVSFEDQGDGAQAVDLLVAEFVDNRDVPDDRKLMGIQYSLLSPVFESTIRKPRQVSRAVDEVLVLFGGTDPSMLGQRALESLSRVGYTGKVTVVRGLGAAPVGLPAEPWPFELKVLQNVKNMAAVMSRADLAFTSAGRTVIELISQGVPAICLAQNAKELTHTHAVAENGVYPLGLGAQISDDELDAVTMTMIDDHDLRNFYASRAEQAGSLRSNRLTISTILKRIGFEDFPDI